MHQRRRFSPRQNWQPWRARAPRFGSIRRLPYCYQPRNSAALTQSRRHRQTLRSFPRARQASNKVFAFDTGQANMLHRRSSSLIFQRGAGRRFDGKRSLRRHKGRTSPRPQRNSSAMPIIGKLPRRESNAANIITATALREKKKSFRFWANRPSRAGSNDLIRAAGRSSPHSRLVKTHFHPLFPPKQKSTQLIVSAGGA